MLPTATLNTVQRKRNEEETQPFSMAALHFLAGGQTGSKLES